MFKTTTLIVALGMTPAMGTAVASADAPIRLLEDDRQADIEYTTGTITNIDADDDVFTIETASGAKNQVTYGDMTVFMHEGDEADADGVLRHNQKVMIEHREGLALLVIAYENESDAEFERDWGTITNIDADDDTFTIEMANGLAKQVTIGDDTVYLKDGEVCPWEDVLDYDNNVRVLHREGLATYVIYTSHHDEDQDEDGQ